MKKDVFNVLKIQSKSVTETVIALASIVIGVWFLIAPIATGLLFIRILSFFILLGGSAMLFLYYRGEAGRRSRFMLILGIGMLGFGILFISLPFFFSRAIFIFAALVIIVLQISNFSSFSSLHSLQKVATVSITLLALALIFFPSLGLGIAGYLAGASFLAIGIEKMISYFK